MTASFTVRLDDEAEHELDELTDEGRSRNAVIRYALVLAHRAQAADQMRRESATLLNDPDDQAEIAAAREAMGAGMRGDVYRLKAVQRGRGHEQQGARYARSSSPIPS